MSNPYDDIFNEGTPQKQKPEEQFPDAPIPPPNPEPSKEPLDEILELNTQFNQEAEAFSRLLSETSVIDHKENTGILQYFVVIPEKNRPDNLADERIYHGLLKRKFEAIITPMVKLATIHREAIKTFNENIDDEYYSVEQSDGQVKINKTIALDGINLQRKVLADAANHLKILDTALEVSEGRLSNYVNAGGTDNISAAELAIIAQKRTTLTRGLNHQFDYSFFTINLLDKTALTFGVHMKETSAQYLNNLSKAFAVR